ncbi:hypothetical protein C1645_693912, partial [Glomus cerebriforme]
TYLVINLPSIYTYPINLPIQLLTYLPICKNVEHYLPANLPINLPAYISIYLPNY